MGYSNELLCFLNFVDQNCCSWVSFVGLRKCLLVSAVHFASKLIEVGLLFWC